MLLSGSPPSREGDQHSISSTIQHYCSPLKSSFSQCRLTPREELQFGNAWLKEKAKKSTRCWSSQPRFLRRAVCHSPSLFLSSAASLKRAWDHCSAGLTGQGKCSAQSSALRRGPSPRLGGCSGQKPRQHSLTLPRSREPPRQAGPRGTIETQGGNNSAQWFICTWEARGLICATPRGRGKIKVIKMFVSFSELILEVKSVKEISPQT